MGSVGFCFALMFAFIGMNIYDIPPSADVPIEHYADAVFMSHAMAYFIWGISIVFIGFSISVSRPAQSYEDQ